MKNPLIEAIRQAGDDNDTSQQRPETETTLDVTGEPANDEHVIDTEALELMETVTSLEVGDTEDEIAPDTQAEDLQPDTGEETRAEPMTDPAAPIEAGGLEIRISHDQRARGLPLLGRLAPLLCLLGAGTAAAVYVTYQLLGGGYQGSDLAALSARALAGGRLTDSGNDGSGLPPSPFTLDEASPRPRAPRSSMLPDTGTLPSRVRDRRPTIAAPEESAPHTQPGAVVVDEAYPVIESAFDAFAKGDFVAAEAGYRSALDIAPRHPNALEGLGALLLKMDRRDEALETFDALLSVDPGNVVASAALLSAGEDEDGTATESAFKHLVQQHPDSPQLRFALGAHFANVSRWPEARLEFEQARRLDPKNPEYLYNLAVALEHLGQAADAAKHYELALASISDSSSLDAAQVTARLERLASNVTIGEKSR